MQARKHSLLQGSHSPTLACYSSRVHPAACVARWDQLLNRYKKAEKGSIKQKLTGLRATLSSKLTRLQVEAADAEMTVIHINTDDSQRWTFEMLQYGIKDIPCLVLLNSQGVSHEQGACTAANLLPVNSKTTGSSLHACRTGCVQDKHSAVPDTDGQ